MTTSQGLRDKSPNTPFDTLKLIEDMLGLVLVKQDDGRWRYPDKQNDQTLAETIGRGATHSAVRKMRMKNHPGGLVIQQIHSRAKKVEAEVKADPEPYSDKWLDDPKNHMMLRGDLDQLHDAVAAKVAELVAAEIIPLRNEIAELRKMWA